MAVNGINAIETSFVKDYGTNIELLVQQIGSVFRPCVYNDSFVGESAAVIEQVGEVSAQVRATRHGDTPLVPTPMDRRWCFPTDFELADLIDTQDKLRQIIDPTNMFAQAQAAALGRSIDDIIIEAILGDNKTGQNAGTTVALPAAQQIDNGGTGMTIEKLRTALEKFENANVDLERENVYAVISPEQKRQLLSTTEVTNADYNTVRALANGEIDTFLGFKFKTSTRLLGGAFYGGTRTPTANMQTATFFTEKGVGLGMWNDISSRIDERADKSYAWQVYSKGTFGATRLQEEKVITIETDKTK